MPVIDHVPFAANDHDAAVKRFENAGLPTTYGGRHPEQGTEMSMVVLPDGSYLEIIAPAEDADDPGYWPDHLAADAGPCAWCVDSGSVHATCQRAITQDIEVHGPLRGTRDTPAGERAEWDMAYLGPRDDGLLPFTIADRTPREFRVPDSDLYGAPISGISHVVIAVPDLDAASRTLTRLYRFPEPRTGHDDYYGDLAVFPGENVVLAEPARGPLDDRVDAFGAVPATVLLGGDVDGARHSYSLGDATTILDSRVRYVDGFDRELAVVDR
ncbi:VOC family protein [Halocalculus aciditolerans]|uniref:VOC domain-containing protein n=1 Tax=Halocalculus aciditolerans TaxID=1383812 RepID=A0A830F292_9EURY|nr:VOC family protein [Halocalculus aciditolerans]GGL55454.1 hypothetical protein GCM10009039_11990 [Halocalculus aciditolerans]